jgi:hypothetical protein
VDVVKAIVKRIDEPNIDYSINQGLFFFTILISLCFLDIAKEYAENRTEFNNKALEMVKKYSIPRN